MNLRSRPVVTTVAPAAPPEPVASSTEPPADSPYPDPRELGFGHVLVMSILLATMATALLRLTLNLGQFVFDQLQ